MNLKFAKHPGHAPTSIMLLSKATADGGGPYQGTANLIGVRMTLAELKGLSKLHDGLEKLGFNYGVMPANVKLYAVATDDGGISPTGDTALCWQPDVDGGDEITDMVDRDLDGAAHDATGDYTKRELRVYGGRVDEIQAQALWMGDDAVKVAGREFNVFDIKEAIEWMKKHGA